MKRIALLLILIVAGLMANAQTPGIRISYDANGNRILRYFSPNRPAPPADSTSADSTIASNIKDSTQNGAEMLKQGFKVYPNPSEDNFNIAIAATMLTGNCEITVTDQLGKVHLRKKLSQAITTISTKDLADGVYYLNLTTGNAKTSTKIVKRIN